MVNTSGSMRLKTEYDCRGIQEERMMIRNGLLLLSSPSEHDRTSSKEPTVDMIMGGPTEEDSNWLWARLNSIRDWRGEVQSISEEVVVEFGAEEYVYIQSPQTDAMVIAPEIVGYNVESVSVDIGSSVDIMFIFCFRKMRSTAWFEPVETSLFGFITIFGTNNIHESFRVDL